MKFVNIGYGNLIAAERVVSVLSPDSSPVKRLVSDAKNDGRVIDVTSGKKTRAVILTDTEHVFLSALMTSTVTARLEGNDAAEDTTAEE